MACWAPLVPFAKARLGINEAELGLLLLCVGIGSLVSMPLTGMVAARFGSKPMILAGGICTALLLPVLGCAASVPVMAAALLLFGASLGTIDVAMNIHAVDVERDAGKPLMSGFHGLFSVGGFAGSGGMTLLLSIGIPPFPAVVALALLTLAVIGIAAPRLLQTVPQAGGPLFAVPRGIVILLAALAALTFLVEGAILDWGALLTTQRNLVVATQGGVAYMLFSIAMTVGRLSGDRVIARFGRRRVFALGGLLASGGFIVLLRAPVAAVAMSGFILVGLGAANLVPVLFSAAGRQTAMPSGLAVAAITTTGYAGILAGPALIGFVAHAVGLSTAFWLLAGLMCLVPVFARPATR